MCAIAWKRQRDAVRMKKQAMDRAAQKSSIKRSTRRQNGPGNEAKTVYPGEVCILNKCKIRFYG